MRLYFYICGMVALPILSNFSKVSQLGRGRAETQTPACAPPSPNMFFQKHALLSFQEHKVDGGRWVVVVRRAHLDTQASRPPETPAGNGGLGILRILPGPAYEGKCLGGLGPTWSGHQWALCDHTCPLSPLQRGSAVEAQFSRILPSQHPAPPGGW